jgi:hypothetical protein
MPQYLIKELLWLDVIMLLAEEKIEENTMKAIVAVIAVDVTVIQTTVWI